MPRTFRLALLVFVLALVASACGEDDGAAEAVGLVELGSQLS